MKIVGRDPGRWFVVAGCGPSARRRDAKEFVARFRGRGGRVLGVNDAGRWLPLDYLYLQGRVREFGNEARRRGVLDQTCPVFHVHDDPYLRHSSKHESATRVRLGSYWSRERFADTGGLGYGESSVYAAVLLAEALGASDGAIRRIGLLGVDLRGHRTFDDPTYVREISRSLAELRRALGRRYVVLENLSRGSLLGERLPTTPFYVWDEEDPLSLT